MIKLSDYVFDFVSRLGVKQVFLLPGGGCMHLVDSLGRQKELEPVCCLHEQAAAIAADSYAQYTKNIGVLLVTTGPGGTNAVTGVTASWIDSTPIIVLSGQVKRSDMIGSSGVRQLGLQEADIISIVKPITKYAVTVTEPKTIRYHLEKAAFLAKTGRSGPVWIDIPLDVQGAKIDETELEPFSPSEADVPRPLNISEKVKEVVRLISGAERPVILAGNGVHLAKAEKEFLALADLLKVPVLETWRVLDLLSDDHEFYFGRPGAIGQRGANFIQQNSDMIITIGARLDLGQVGHNYKNFARAAKKVIVDIDQAEINKLKMEIDVPVCADAKDFIEELLKQAETIEKRDRSEWLDRCREWRKRYPVILPEYWETKGRVNTYVLVDVLSDLLTPDDVLIPGSSGSCSEITLQAFRAKSGQRIFNTPGLGAMGFGLAASMGGCIASGKRTTTLIGDGGFQLNIQELETIVRLKLPLKIFILNNNAYGSIRATQNKFFDGRLVCCDPSSGLTLPDTCKIAAAYGIRAVKIESHENIRDLVKDILDFQGPVICEVMVDPDLQTAPKLSSMVLSDGSIVSKPLEDLWPFLDREEFNSNMIIPPLKEV